jgi:hypothetical protein
MDWKEVGGILRKVAPALATALGGPLAGGAVAALEGVFGGKEGASTSERAEALVAAISGATPDQMLALKKADQDFAVRMEELGVKKQETSNADRDSARKREIEVKDNTPKVLAYAITLGFFSVLAALMYGKIPADSKDVLYIMLGTLGTAWTGVISYYYGSTNGSAEKSKLLAQSIPADKKV